MQLYRILHLQMPYPNRLVEGDLRVQNALPPPIEVPAPLLPLPGDNQRGEAIGGGRIRRPRARRGRGRVEPAERPAPYQRPAEEQENEEEDFPEVEFRPARQLEVIRVDDDDDVQEVPQPHEPIPPVRGN
jgi:hypothetical protein